MKLIIDIDEELYGVYKGRPPMLGDGGMDMIAQAIVNGTPLPKGHGRLIDADDVDNHIIGSVDLRDCPTIIEADYLHQDSITKSETQTYQMPKDYIKNKLDYSRPQGELVRKNTVRWWAGGADMEGEEE